MALIEYARHVAGLKDANSTEFNIETPHPVVALITEWTGADGAVEKRTQHSDLGGTMRLGGQVCHLIEKTKAKKIYNQAEIRERHRHRYEVNNNYVEALEKAGLVVSGRSVDGNLVEMVELNDHPWFVGCQFHPEFTSTPREGHPLFKAFIEEAKK